MKLKMIALFSLLCLSIFQSCNKQKDSRINPADTESKASKKKLMNQTGLLECRTPDSLENQDFEKLAPNRRSLLTVPAYCINVSIHIVRETNGTGGFNGAFADDIIQNLNDAYNYRRIYFYKASVDYIDNSTYYSLDVNTATNEFPGLIGINNNANALNLYLVSSISDVDGAYAGLAEDIPSKNAAIDQSVALQATTMHEVGHCLNLFHTHRGRGCADTGACQEATDGSNCTTCGDFVCDTPADPCLSGQVNSACTFTGTGFSPLTNNFMSYSTQACRTAFTNGQESRMHAALDAASVLQPIKKSTCDVPEITGPSDACKPTVYTLSSVPSGATVVWSASRPGAVTFSNQTSNTITVTQVDGEYGSVLLWARITTSGQSISVWKAVYLPTPNAPSIALNPASSSCLTWNTERNFAAGYTTTGPWQDINTHPDAAEVDWKIYDYSTSPATMITSYTKTNSTVLGNSIYLWLHSNSSQYVIEIVCRAKDKCGNWNSWSPGHAYFIKQSCTSFMALDVTYDSKAKGHNIGFSSDYNNLRSILAGNKNRHAKMTNDFDLSIYNSAGNRIFHNEKATTPRTFLRGLTSGNYKIVLLQDGNIYEQALNVK
ncbi:hypothetical protein LL912_12410 [Niabella sp. CC-SYL272]|uniref:M43 family zinc metalloprotease n=1 Tax=Niabella agricola TaxID=2891571 RepID=UPI001EED3924|nr:M43 family zinc metalloprotease [Niabella agricola]MCF3109575.1 hypothetical protein [Niabella agricola]